MSNSPPRDPERSRLRAGSDDEFEHVTTGLDTGAVECTIFPRDCTEQELLTHWITAGSDSFVSLEESR